MEQVDGGKGQRWAGEGQRRPRNKGQVGPPQCGCNEGLLGSGLACFSKAWQAGTAAAAAAAWPLPKAPAARQSIKWLTQPVSTVRYLICCPCSPHIPPLPLHRTPPPQVMEEIIAKSKAAKAQKAQQKEADEEALAQLDSTFKSLVADKDAGLAALVKPAGYEK